MFFDYSLQSFMNFVPVILNILAFPQDIVVVCCSTVTFAFPYPLFLYVLYLESFHNIETFVEFEDALLFSDFDICIFMLKKRFIDSHIILLLCGLIIL